MKFCMMDKKLMKKLAQQMKVAAWMEKNVCK
jgi:hypothetical protein